MSPDARRKRVLVAEDDPAVLDLVVTRLILAGYDTVQARDGYEALDAICIQRPDATVLDVNLPGLDGFEVLRRLKDRVAALAYRPAVLVLSARKASNDIETAIKLGARDYMSKPFDEALFLQRVARLLRPAPTLPAAPAPALAAPAPREDVFI